MTREACTSLMAAERGVRQPNGRRWRAAAERRSPTGIARAAGETHDVTSPHGAAPGSERHSASSALTPAPRMRGADTRRPRECGKLTLTGPPNAGS